MLISSPTAEAVAGRRLQRRHITSNSCNATSGRQLHIPYCAALSCTARHGTAQQLVVAICADRLFSVPLSLSACDSGPSWIAVHSHRPPSPPHSTARPQSVIVMPLPKSTEECEAQVRSWGFPHVFTWTDGPYVNSTPPLISFSLASCDSLARGVSAKPPRSDALNNQPWTLELTKQHRCSKQCSLQPSLTLRAHNPPDSQWTAHNHVPRTREP